jgi:transposase InsO family protein
MTKQPTLSIPTLWARFRFSVVGALLSAPPARGELKAALESLAEKTWTHPVTGREIRFAAKTIERWLYRARHEQEDPVGVLRRAVRKDCGKVSLKPQLVECLVNQYHDYPHWTYQLHYDNLKALVKSDAKLGSLQSYSTVRRYMLAQGMLRKPRLKPKKHPGELRAAQRRERREIRSYEAEYVGALWHLDFHHGSLQVVTPRGQWQRPLALGILDDHSRYCPHLQWYLSETTEDLVHGFSQGIQKCGLPRAGMSDNGSAMLADEFTEGLLRLGILHETTLPFSAYQNGKQENFWAHLEGRLLEMLGKVRELTLDFLNEVTQAWVEIEYHRRVHREIGCSPAARFAAAPDVLRPSPSSDALRAAFRREVKRRQRQSDGTISLDGVRFEIPSRYRHFRDVVVRYPRWDLSLVDLVDPREATILARLFPLDRAANADGRRAVLEPRPEEVPRTDTSRSPSELPPLLKQILAEYSATGLPPAYLPKNASPKQAEQGGAE